MQSKGFSPDFLYQLKMKNDIVSVISRYVSLARKGKTYWGCCPFHSEKTPSFAVNPDEGFYHCFGCKESGDVISFVQKMESVDFYEAVKILAQNAGMQMPEYEADEQVIQKKKNKDRILGALDVAWNRYHQNLYLPSAKIAQDYIKLRGFTRHELDDFKIGYANGWTDIIETLKASGYSAEEMKMAGIAQEKNGKPYDVMGGRLVFPIFNAFDECIGFSARALEDGAFAKYKNTAETLVFQKGRVVFAINLLKKLKQKGLLERIIIVEGQIDVIAMHRAGFKNTVACMGTALTEENAHELKKICPNVTLCFDGDGAGQKATLRSIEILRKQDFDIKIATIPDKLDPDEFIKKYGAEKMSVLLDSALGFMDYYFEVEKRNFDLDSRDGQGAYAMAMLEHLRTLESSSLAELYLDKLRDITGIPVDILRRDLVKGTREKAPVQKTEDKVLIERENGNIRAIKFILASLIHKKEYVLENIDYPKLLGGYDEIVAFAKSGAKISSYFDRFDVENMPILKDALMYNFEVTLQSEVKYFEQCLWQLAEEKIIAMQKQLTLKYKNCTDVDERKQMARRLLTLSSQLKKKSLEEFYV